MTDCDWNTLELRSTRGPRTLALRLHMRGIEHGRMDVHLDDAEGLVPLGAPTGPAWGLELMMEAASEWARLEGTRQEINP